MVTRTPGRGIGRGMGGDITEYCLPHYPISATVCSYAVYPATALLILMLLMSTVPILLLANLALSISFLCS